MFINVICELLMNLIDCNDFVTLITDSISVEVTCRELNSYNLYEFPHDRYRANNCHLEDKVPGTRGTTYDGFSGQLFSKF